MRFWLLICLYVASSHAVAGLFADDDARKQVQQQEARIVKLEQALASSEADKEQYVRSILDLQTQGAIRLLHCVLIRSPRGDLHLVQRCVLVA